VEDLIDQLLRSEGCTWQLWPQPATVPDFLPLDIQAFFSRVCYGSLFFDRDYPTPQFGCLLGLELRTPLTEKLPAQIDVLNGLIEIGEYDAGCLDYLAVDIQPETFGQIVCLHYSAGDPELMRSDVRYFCSSFRRLIEIHIAAWATYQDDWRDGLAHFTYLLDHDRRQHPRQN
jgi:hypothetical protein